MILEKRDRGEVRTFTEEGIVDAYLTAWDVTDSYNSTFRRGAFQKTFAENLSNMRLLWNHDELAGKILSAKEDSYGALVSVQFNLDTDIGKRAFSHIKAGDIKCFSFGFFVKKDEVRNGIREISEVDCIECSPVVFEANHAAKIVNIRADNFYDTYNNSEKARRGYALIDALFQTLDDIRFDSDSKDIKSKIDIAISVFHREYLNWIDEIYNDTISYKNELQKAFHEYRKERSLETLAMESPFMLSELRMLARGELLPLAKRDHLANFSKEIQQAHDKIRQKKIEEFCNELRKGGLTDIEKKRCQALLGKSFEELFIEDIRKARGV